MRASTRMRAPSNTAARNETPWLAPGPAPNMPFHLQVLSDDEFVVDHSNSRQPHACHFMGTQELSRSWV